MEWLNVRTSIIGAPAYVGSNPIERATWFNVLAYCADQENGGVIAGAEAWKDRQWQQSCGVTAAEVRRASKLITFADGSVVVAFYPTEKEAEVRARRVQAADAARKRWERQHGIASGNAPRIADSITPRNAEENGMEENGTRSDRNARASVPVSDEDWLKSLADSPAYAGIDVCREHAKMSTWCTANGKQATRRRFVNWLNRVEKPMGVFKTQPRRMAI